MSETTDETIHTLVVGLGDFGAQAINNMRVLGLEGAKFAICSENDEGVYLSAEESKVRFKDDTNVHELLAAFDIVFIVADMSGDFDAEYAPRIGYIAKEKGALTIGVVTSFDTDALEEKHQMVESIDTLITIPHQSPDSSTTDNSSASTSEQALYQAVKAILDMQKSTLTVDLADISSFLKNGGLGMFGTGYDLAVENAAIKATRSPLLGTASVSNSTSVVVTITGPSSVNFLALHSAVQIIMDELHPDANLIFGVVVDDNMEGVHVALIATRLLDEESA